MARQRRPCASSTSLIRLLGPLSRRFSGSPARVANGCAGLVRCLTSGANEYRRLGMTFRLRCRLGIARVSVWVFDSDQTPMLALLKASTFVADRKYSRSGANVPPGGTAAGCTVNDGAPSIGPALMSTTVGAADPVEAAAA